MTFSNEQIKQIIDIIVDAFQTAREEFFDKKNGLQRIGQFRLSPEGYILYALTPPSGYICYDPISEEIYYSKIGDLSCFVDFSEFIQDVDWKEYQQWGLKGLREECLKLVEDSKFEWETSVDFYCYSYKARKAEEEAEYADEEYEEEEDECELNGEYNYDPDETRAGMLGRQAEAYYTRMVEKYLLFRVKK